MPSTATDRIDGLTTSVAVKAPCRVATTANITLSGLQTIDGVSLAAEDRVLVKNQTSAVDNGIWVVGTGTWQRSRDFDGARDVVKYTIVFAGGGSTQEAGFWQVTSSNPITIGTTAIAFSSTLSSLTGREILSEPRTYYVATTGSNSNDGLTAITPFLTIQKAVDTVCDTLILNNVQVRIQLADGTYNETILMRRYVGSFNNNANPITSGDPGPSFTLPTIYGNKTTPGNVVVNGGFTGVNVSTPWFFSHFRINAPGSTCLLADWITNYYYGHMVFGAASTQVFAQRGSRIEMFGGMGNTEIVGNATVHAAAGYQSEIILQGGITLTGTPAFTYFLQSYIYSIISNDATYTGTGTGARYNENDGRCINGDSSPTNLIGLLQGDSKVQEPANIYVSTTGSNNNTGLTAGSPFATIQFAISWIKANVRMRNSAITINLAAGTYAEDINYAGMPELCTSITILGDIAAPASYVLNGLQLIQQGANIFFKGIKGISSGDFIMVREFSKATIVQGCQFGTMTGSCMISDGGSIEILSPYTINGSQAYHWFAYNRGKIKGTAITVTLSGTPAFTAFAKTQDQGVVNVPGFTYSGSATGKRFESNTQAMINTNTAAAASTLPGNSSGTVDATTFSVYI